MNLQPKTYSPQKPYSSIRASDYPMPSTVKKAHPLNQQSPYTHSPLKMNYSIVSQDEAELYRLKCQDLERELAKYRTDMDLQRLVHTKSTDLEAKVAEVLEHNNTLQAQLDRAQKATSQRKSEADMWKQKYEVQQGQLMQIRQNYESEIRTLSQQIQEVNAKINLCEQDRNRCISDQRTIADTQNHQITESFKRSNSMQADLYEAQLKKLRDILEDKTLQVAQLHAALEKSKVEANDAQLRLMNELEQQKARISSIQIDHQTEMQVLKSKLELYQETNLKNAEMAHQNQADLLLQEIDKLKSILEIKNQEIDTLISQNQKQKYQFDQECNGLRSDIEALKRQLLNSEQTHQQENHNIQQNLENMHNNETTTIKLTHENQIQSLNREILKLKEIIDTKNQEIEKQMVEKAQQKDYYDGEIQRLLNTVDDFKRKLIFLENEKNREISDQHNRIERLTLQYEAMQQELQKQLALLNQELSNLKGLLDHKNQEIQQNGKLHSQIKIDLEERIRGLQNELDLQKLRHFEYEKSKLQEVNEMRALIKDMDTSFKEKVRQLEQTIEHQKYEINKTLDMFTNKSKECENLQIQRSNSESIQKKLQEENERFKDKLYQFEKEKNLEIDELRKKMDSGAAYQFENLKSAYNTQVGILSDQIQDLQAQLAQKTKEHTEMIEKYSILDKSLLPESLVVRNTYNSRVGVPAEFLANKSIHEVTVRSQLRNSSIQRY